MVGMRIYGTQAPSPAAESNEINSSKKTKHHPKPKTAETTRFLNLKPPRAAPEEDPELRLR